MRWQSLSGGALATPWRACGWERPSSAFAPFGDYTIPLDAEPPNVLNALVRKRADVAGLIEHTQLSLRHLIAELDHLDETIRIYPRHLARLHLGTGLTIDGSVAINRSQVKPMMGEYVGAKQSVRGFFMELLRLPGGGTLFVPRVGDWEIHSARLRATEASERSRRTIEATMTQQA